MQYFFASGNEQKGPYSLEELAALGLRPDTLIWHDGLAQWKPAHSLPELAAIAAPAAPLQVPVATDSISSPLEYQQNTARPTDGFAIASLVLGLISFPSVCAWGLGFIPAVLAVVFGFIARGRIKRGQTDGDSMALTGLICGAVTILMVAVFIVVAAAIGLSSVGKR